MTLIPAQPTSAQLTSAQTMTAIGFQQYGPPSVLQQVQLPMPGTKTGQLRIRVLAAGLNPADANIRAGMFRRIMRQPFPIVPGSDIAGLVESVGEGVTRFKVGDAVYGLLPLLRGGGYGEYVVADAGAVALKPATLDFAQAAAVPLAALTALQGLQDIGQLRAGQRVLINGASGGVGTFALQIAKAIGAHVTTLTSARNLGFAKQLGADEALDYATSDFSVLNGQMDVVFDCAVTLKFAQAGPWLRRGGSFVSLVPVPNPIGILRAKTSGKHYRWLLVKPSQTQLETISAWIEAGTVRPIIERVLRPDEIEEGHRLLESKRVRGKLVLTRAAD